MRHTSAQGHYRLRRAPQLAVDHPYSSRNRNRFAGGRGRSAGASDGNNAAERASIAADRGKDGGTVRPDHHSSIRASTAISSAQGEAKHDAGEQCLGWAKRARERVVDDAPARPRQIAQPNTRALTDTPKTTH